jgi:hypothetical protein
VQGGPAEGCSRPTREHEAAHGQPGADGAVGGVVQQHDARVEADARLDGAVAPARLVVLHLCTAVHEGEKGRWEGRWRAGDAAVCTLGQQQDVAVWVHLQACHGAMRREAGRQVTGGAACRPSHRC